MASRKYCSNAHQRTRRRRPFLLAWHFPHPIHSSNDGQSSVIRLDQGRTTKGDIDYEVSTGEATPTNDCVFFLKLQSIEAPRILFTITRSWRDKSEEEKAEWDEEVAFLYMMALIANQGCPFVGHPWQQYQQYGQHLLLPLGLSWHWRTDK